MRMAGSASRATPDVPSGAWSLSIPKPRSRFWPTEGKKLNSPNDVVYKSDGSLYFTDPPYGLPTQQDNDPQKELQVNGVYRIVGARRHKPGVPPDRDKLQLIISDLPRPNGIAFSPDEKTLYIADSGKKVWMRYRVNADGSVSDGKLLLDASGDKAPGGPDGIRVDKNGNIYGSGPGGSGSFPLKASIWARSTFPRSSATWPGATKMAEHCTSRPAPACTESS